jgi:hypothetical protein
MELVTCLRRVTEDAEDTEEMPSATRRAQESGLEREADRKQA